jgi:mono/diheme cytochrome c family protein
MRKFLLGFVAGVVVLSLVAFCYVRFGFIDPRADKEVSALESTIAMPALDAAVDRRASEAPNPIRPVDDNLTAGMKIYQTNCASCHGDIHRPRGVFADSFYPRAPQFIEDAPDMSENQNFYIIQHGIRLSGMPAWKQVLTEQEIWQVTTFLSHINKLPPQVSNAWKTAAGHSSVDADVSPDSPRMQMKDTKSMGMPMK